MGKTTLRQFIETMRTSFLKDLDMEGRTVKWTDEEIRDFLHFALDAFCEHTAVATATSFEGATGSSFERPENAYDSIADTGLLYVTYGGTIEYLEPVFSLYEPPSYAEVGFVERMDGITLTYPLSTGDLHIDYYAYYNHPYADEDTVDVPQWAMPALYYKATSYALIRLSQSTANIRRFNDKRDSGNPEHNPIEQQRRAMEKAFEDELKRRPQQHRVQRRWYQYIRKASYAADD